MLYAEKFLDTTFFRYLLDQDFIEVEKCEGFDDLLNQSTEFYSNAARDIFLINEQKENG